MGKGTGNPKAHCAAAKKATKQKQKPQLHWIKFKIVDEAGNPVPDAILQVIIPGGCSVEATSDANGLIEINNIDAGTCTLDLDWRAVEVKDALFIQ